MSKPPVNLGRITDNFGDDHEFLREVYTLYLDDCSEHMTGLEQSVVNRDVDTCSRLAHAVKGASANIGAEQVQMIASDLEEYARESDHSRIVDSFEALQSEFDVARKFLSDFL